MGVNNLSGLIDYLQKIRFSWDSIITECKLIATKYDIIPELASGTVKRRKKINSFLGKSSRNDTL